MHAFHEIILYTCHTSVIQTLPQQILHKLGKQVAVLQQWAAPEAPPHLVICDNATCAEVMAYAASHPTMAVLVLGNTAPDMASNMPLPLNPALLLDRVETLLFDRVHDVWGNTLPLAPDMAYLPKERRLYTGNHAQELTEKEHLLLITLYHFSPLPVTRAFLLETVFGYADSAETHTLETHLSRLRGKWKELGHNEHIHHADGGYVLVTSP